jgi:site-specific DNA-methyltransferase (adenine-specific)/adenine-specific DNA-methyltransferase
MNKLSEEEIKFITQCLKERKPLPDSYRHVIPFETKKEYELTYAEKEREENVLVDTMAVPLQPIKTFGNGGEGWTNKLIFGDNLQVLKSLMDNPQFRGKVKLIYIDPPFTTKQEFRGSLDQKAYQDKVIGAQFLEFLRKRLIFFRELLAHDGVVYVHLDYRKKHYVKALMDEIFGENNFRNEIAVSRIKKNVQERGKVRKLNEEFDTILLYSKSENLLVFPPRKQSSKPERWHSFEAAGFRTGMDYKLFGFVPGPNRHWRWTKEKAEQAIAEGRLRPNPNTGKPEYLVSASETTLCNNLWNDLTSCSFKWNYPTEKNEKLLERIINMASEPGDLVLDCFAGSGTTGAIAEKLGRRWIMIDCGKLAIYTMQKRLLNLKEETTKKRIKPKPFTLYNAGLYDYSMIKELPWEQYRDFVLKLFQCRDEKHRIAGVELDGYLGADDVLVFNYKKHEDVVLDREFIDDLHKVLGERIRRRFFIIAPAASVSFLEDYIEKGKTKYFVLRIPYSIIDELHRKGFAPIKQPVSEMDVNDTIDAVGFDFIRTPEVECRYSLDKKSKECVIKIKKFESRIISKKLLKFENLETLSIVMIDYDHDGKVFDFDEVFYAEDLKQKKYEIRFDSGKIDGQAMIIYLDIFGNEKREVKKLKDFGRG